MKIAFLTNCLEPGCDGVGDYTTLLAAECERRGHRITRVALNDSFVKTEASSANELRLGAGQSWAERVENARDFLAAFAPDFVSLQFVCYGFHLFGIDFSLASRLCKIIGARPLHLMLHELWIGAENGAPLKERVLGALQRRALLGLIRNTRPRVIHTSNPAYVHLLHEQRICATRLPLFGSIPVPPLQTAARKIDGAISFAIFGTLHPVWPPEPLFTHLRGLGKKNVITHVGRIGAGAPLWEKVVSKYGGNFEFRSLGEQPPEKIAELFSHTDFGIATTPWSLVGKSATIAAMLDHGIPVIVNRDDVRYKGLCDEPASPLLIKMDSSLPSKLAAVRLAEPRPTLPEIAGQFLQSLSSTPP